MTLCDKVGDQVENVITFMVMLGIEMYDDNAYSWFRDTMGDYDSEQFVDRQYVGPRLRVLAGEPGTCDTSGG